MPWASLPDNTGHVYVLLEPERNEIRYVGQTRRAGGGRARLSSHTTKMRREPNNHTHLYNWLRSLHSAPRVQLLAVVNCDQLNECEMYWISYLRSIGCDLVNGTQGGTGGPIRLGMKTPPETLAKQNAKRMKKHRPSSIELMKQKRAEDRQAPRSCIQCHRVFSGYLALRNHQVKHQKKVLSSDVQTT